MILFLSTALSAVSVRGLSFPLAKSVPNLGCVVGVVVALAGHLTLMTDAIPVESLVTTLTTVTEVAEGAVEGGGGCHET